jgi:methionyl-tRNA formyltransferase
VLAATIVPGSGQPGTILDARFTIACGEGALRLDRVQRAGRPVMPGDAFLRGMAAWQTLRWDAPAPLPA